MTSLPRSLLKAVLELPSASSSSRFPSPVLFRSTHLTFPSTCFSLPPRPNRVNARFFSSPSPRFAPSPSPEPRPTAASSRLDVTSPASAPSTRALTTTSSTLPTTPPPPLEPPGTPIDHPTPLLADWPRRSASKQLSVVASVRSFFDLNRFDTAKRTEEEEVQESKGSYKRLLTLAIPEKKPLLLGLFCLSIGSITGNLLPYAIGQMMDYYGAAVTPEVTFLGLSLEWTLFSLFGCITVGSLAALARSVLLEMSGQRIVARLRKQAYISVLNQEIEFTDSKAGSIVSRLSNDCTVLGENLTDSLQSGSRDFFAGAISLFFMLYISVPVTLVSLIVVPSTVYFSYKYGQWVRKAGRVAQENVGEMTKVAEEKLAIVRIIAAYNAQALESKSFSKKVDSIFEIAKREIWMEGLMTDIYQRMIPAHGAELVLVIFGGYLVQTGSLTLGNLTALLMYQYGLQSAFVGLVGFWSGINKGLGAGARVFELIDRQPQIPPSTGLTLASERTGSIVLKDIAFSYPSRPDSMILKKISLKIQKGESVALCGGSGSGKSSIQNLILRYYEANAGSISFDGQDIRDFSMDSWRNAIGLVSQESIVFTGTIHENIAYGKPGGEATRAEVEAAAEQAGCGFIWDLDRDFDTPVTKTSLSGGQKQRISIARALVRKPRILLLDEATSALDTQSEAHVNAAIEKILETKEITVILVAHRLSSIAQADRVVVVDRGEIVEDGQFDDLINEPTSRFAKLMSAQLVGMHTPHE